MYWTKNKKYTPAAKSKILSEIFFARCMILRSHVLLGVCPYWRYRSSATPLGTTQCSLYQGQQGDVSQSVRGNCKKWFWGEIWQIDVEGYALVYQVYSVCRSTRLQWGEGAVIEVVLFLSEGGMRFPTALSRVDVGACYNYTRVARSRRWCGWSRRRGGGGRGRGDNWSYGMDGWKGNLRWNHLTCGVSYSCRIWF